MLYFWSLAVPIRLEALSRLGGESFGEKPKMETFIRKFSSEICQIANLTGLPKITTLVLIFCIFRPTRQIVENLQGHKKDFNRHTNSCYSSPFPLIEIGGGLDAE